MSLLNKAAVRRWALDYARANRSHKFEQLGKTFYLACELDLRAFIIDRIKRHPSKGVTLR